MSVSQEAVWEGVRRWAPSHPSGFALWCKTFLEWTPHSKQNSFGASCAKLLLLICGIRFGKSDVAAARFLYHMFYTPNGRFLNASFSEDQAKIVVLRAYEMAMNGPLRGFVDRVVKSPHLLLVLKNGATLQARSTKDANLLRGKTYHGINLDEGAYCSREDADVLLGRVLDYDGWVSVTSSPPVMKNWLFEWWVDSQTRQMQGDPRHYAETASTYDNPHMPVAGIKALEAKYTELGAQREIRGEFVDNEGATFPIAIVNPAFVDYEPETSPIPPEQWRTRSVMEEILRLVPADQKAPPNYVASFDLARKKAMFAGVVLETSGKQLRGVERVRGSGIPWLEQCRVIEQTQAKWDANVVIDGTGVGDVVDGMLNVAVTPFIFTPKSRAQGIILMQKVFQEGAIVLPAAWSELRTQLLLHTWKEDAEGQSWDDFDALLMALWKANQMNSTLGFSVIA